MKKALYLLDSYAFIYRSHFAFVNRPLRNPAGINVSAAFGFFRFLFALFAERNPGAFAAVFDSRGKTFRHEMFTEYKATRQKTPEELIAQVPLVEEILEALGVPLLRAEGYEADDVIATLARRCAREGRECWIVSGDKDLLQLVGGTVKALRPGEGFAYRPLGAEEVRAEWGVGPERILDYLSLTGDSSDNIPGVPGIGDKTALKLLTEFDSLESIYGHLDEVKPESLRKKLEAGRESAELSRRLITLADDLDLGLDDLDRLCVEKLDRGAASPLFLREGMRSLAQGGTGAAGSAAGQTAGQTATASIPGRGLPASSMSFTSPASPVSPASGELFDIPEIVPQATVRIEAATHAPESRPGLPVELSGVGDYSCAATEAALAAAIDGCIAAGACAFDCETDGLDPLRASMLGFSLSWAPRKAVYVPLSSPDSKALDPDTARRHLRRLFASGTMVVGHNLKFDRHALERFGAPMGKPIFDTMVAAWLLDAESSSLSLESLAERRLGLKGLSFTEIVPKGATFAAVGIETATRYACEDADFSYRLYRIFAGELERDGLSGLFRDVEMPLLPILQGMETEGITVNSGELRAFGVELENRLSEIQKEIWALVGHEFNIASTKQLQEVLFIERKLPVQKRTKTGYSTDTAVLEELAPLDPVPDLILRHRTMAKLKSTYVDTLASLAERSAIDEKPGTEAPRTFGRVHTTYLQTGAATGRLSSKDPNLQNIPIRDEEGRRIRNAFVAAPGKVLISADYSQIELVVMAHLSGDVNLARAFREGVDVHRRTAALIFGTDEAAVGPEQRRIAKVINFGVIYGMSAFRLANELRIPRGQAQSFIDAYFSTYSGVAEFIRKTIEETEAKGYTSTLLGRRRLIPGINSRNRNEAQAAQRVAVNTPIQGSAADIVKLAMLRVDAALRRELPEVRMLLQVHDELLLEAPASFVDAACILLKREMEEAVVLSVPLRVSLETAKSWGAMH